MSERNFFAELKRRNVYKVAVAYAVVAWLLIQIATATFPVLEIPNWATKLVIALVALGFPIALILAWAFELTPQGIQRTADADAAPNVTASEGVDRSRGDRSRCGGWRCSLAMAIPARRKAALLPPQSRRQQRT